jgi:hypothetical protein
MPKEFKLEKLNKMYEDGKRADEKLFAEQRTNILLRSGDHYNKKSNKLYENLRSRGVISKDQKIRLTKNHIHRVCNVYQNSILEANPSTQATPFNQDELHDVKTAEMAQSVIDWVKYTNNWGERQEKNAHDFSTIGEVFALVRYDYSKGPIIPSETANEMAKKEGLSAARLGEFVVERVFGFDMKRDPNARDDESTRWWIRETMVDLEDFKKIASNLNSDLKDEEIVANGKGTYKIFDANTGEYRNIKDQILVKELYYKPGSVRYPNGWYAMFTQDFVVVQDELPFGIYPIVKEGFDELTTSPRSTSIVRVCRPYQVEINRASSKMAEHQITLGDDKVFIQKGTKISNGGRLHGVRAFQVSGQEPKIQAGRSGAQYLDYQLSQIREMYEAANLEHVMADKEVVGDPYQLLFRSMKEKKRFVKYVGKFERFEKKIFQTVLDMAKFYLTPDHIIRVAGRSEILNIEEFKSIDQSKFEIKVVPQSGDIETKFGKILSITQTLQYTGSQLKPEQIGELVRQLPFGNDEQIFSTLTVDRDNAVNDILALDRGEQVPVNPSDNHEFMIQALTHRVKKSDFRFLDPAIQEAYQVKIAQHDLFFQQQRELIAQQNMGMVPTGGFLTTVNASWFNPTTNRVERIKVPSDALQWLVQKLQTQGTFNQSLEDLPQDAQARILSAPLQAGQQGLPQEPQAPLPNTGPQAF